jgi:ribosomal protein L27
MSIIVGVLLSACRVGGQISVTPTPTPFVAPDIAAPFVTSPSESPYYSASNSLELSGMCSEGSRMVITGDASRTVLCEDSAFSFSVSKTIDGVYQYFITQYDPDGAVSAPTPFTWIRKTSVPPPSITSPTLLTQAGPIPFQYKSAAESLTFRGNCESGSTISAVGDVTGSTQCIQSAFTLSVQKATEGNFDFSIRQTDLAGNRADVSLTWKRAVLRISPSAPNIVVQATQVVTLTGGSEQYTVDFATNNSGATFNSTTLTYTAGTIARVTDTLRVTDSLGQIVTIPIQTLPSSADRLEIISGDGQSLRAGAVLTNDLEVKVTDRYGNGVASSNIVFQVLEGQVDFQTDPRKQTDANGVAKIKVVGKFRNNRAIIRVKPASGTLPDVTATGRSTVSFSILRDSLGSGTLGTVFSVGSGPSSPLLLDLRENGYKDLIVANSGEANIGILSGRGNGQFENMRRVNTCSGPGTIRSGDLNADNHVDLVVICGGSDQFSVLIGNGDGTFVNAVTTDISATEPSASDLRLVDYDGDLKLDLLILSSNSSFVSFRKGVGNGTFGSPLFTVATGPVPMAFDYIDVDGDGLKDLITANTANNSVTFIKNTGSIQSSASVNISTCTGPNALLLSDYTADGKKDLLVTCSLDAKLQIFPYSVGLADFDAPSDFNTGLNPVALAEIDFNDDGKKDVLVANNADSTVTLLSGNGLGGFPGTSTRETVNSPVALGATDLNGDNLLDLVIPSNGASVVQILPLREDGGFGLQFPTANAPRNASTGDLNGDGKQDLVVVSSDTRELKTYLGQGNGMLTVGASKSTGLDPLNVILIDVDVDGKLDAIVTQKDSNSLGIFMGNGDGTFDNRVDIGTAGRPLKVRAADINGDGIIDLVTVNSQSNSISALLGNGDGTFQTKTDFTTGNDPNDVQLADLNRDGNVDAVVLSAGETAVLYMAGNGDGSFQPPVSYEVNVSSTALEVAELNGDGFLDLVVVSPAASSVSVFMGIGDGSFNQKTDYFGGAAPSKLIIADINADNKLDLLTVNGPNNSVSVLMGNGSGAFNTIVDYPTFGNASSFESTDLNGDRILDWIILDENAATLDVLLGN